MIAKLGAYEKALDEQVEWSRSPQIGLRVLSRAENNARLALESLDSVDAMKRVNSGLGKASQWFFSNSVVQLYEGNSDGWELYEKALYLSSWEARTHIRIYCHLNPLGHPYRLPSYFSHAKNLISALAHGATLKSSETMGAFFLSEATEHDLTFDLYGERLPEMNAFPLWLYCKQADLDWAEVVEQRFPQVTLGIFQRVSDSWDDIDALSDAIVRMLDVHLERLEVKQQVYLEFHGKPFSLIPTEYYALVRVRRKLGLETPKPKHRLLQEGLFGEIPDTLPKGEDTIFDQAISRVKELFPDV